jgi:translation initiation factor IF-3
MQSDKPLINEQIKHKSLLVINHDGKNLGVIPLTKALQLAQAEELDLVLINDSDDARKPAVAKIIDCGKYLYNLKIKQSNSKQKTLKQKEIAVKPQIGFNDLSTNAKKAIG